MNRRIACVGARKLAPAELHVCYSVGRKVAAKNDILVSGGALGADLSFMTGALEFGGRVVVVLPWEKYNADAIDSLGRRHPGRLTRVVYSTSKHHRWRTLAKACHPGWHNLGENGKKFHARNAGIFIGEELDEVVEMVYAFPNRERKGGTMQSFRLAEFLRIPLEDLRQDDV